MGTTDTKRRNFLKSSALVGTGLMLANPFSITANPLKAADKVNVGVVGCGGRGGGGYQDRYERRDRPY